MKRININKGTKRRKLVENRVLITNAKLNMFECERHTKPKTLMGLERGGYGSRGRQEKEDGSREIGTMIKGRRKELNWLE